MNDSLKVKKLLHVPIFNFFESGIHSHLNQAGVSIHTTSGIPLTLHLSKLAGQRWEQYNFLGGLNNDSVFVLTHFSDGSSFFEIRYPINLGNKFDRDDLSLFIEFLKNKIPCCEFIYFEVA